MLWTMFCALMVHRAPNCVEELFIKEMYFGGAHCWVFLDITSWRQRDPEGSHLFLQASGFDIFDVTKFYWGYPLFTFGFSCRHCFVIKLEYDWTMGKPTVLFQFSSITSFKNRLINQIQFTCSADWEKDKSGQQCFLTLENFAFFRCCSHISNQMKFM